jgi:hypothetical protein
VGNYADGGNMHLLNPYQCFVKLYLSLRIGYVDNLDFVGSDNEFIESGHCVCWRVGGGVVIISIVDSKLRSSSS